jgi:hypothetical protein
MHDAVWVRGFYVFLVVYALAWLAVVFWPTQ